MRYGNGSAAVIRVIFRVCILIDSECYRMLFRIENQVMDPVCVPSSDWGSYRLTLSLVLNAVADGICTAFSRHCSEIIDRNDRLCCCLERNPDNLVSSQITFQVHSIDDDVILLDLLTDSFITYGLHSFPKVTFLIAIFVFVLLLDLARAVIVGPREIGDIICHDLSVCHFSGF